MNAIIERAELERAQRQFRQLSDELKKIAPMVALKAGALAQECVLRMSALEDEPRSGRARVRVIGPINPERLNAEYEP